MKWVYIHIWVWYVFFKGLPNSIKHIFIKIYQFDLPKENDMPA